MPAGRRLGLPQRGRAPGRFACVHSRGSIVRRARKPARTAIAVNRGAAVNRGRTGRDTEVTARRPDSVRRWTRPAPGRRGRSRSRKTQRPWPRSSSSISSGRCTAGGSLRTGRPDNRSKSRSLRSGRRKVVIEACATRRLPQRGQRSRARVIASDLKNGGPLDRFDTRDARGEAQPGI